MEDIFPGLTPSRPKTAPEHAKRGAQARGGSPSPRPPVSARNYTHRSGGQRSSRANTARSTRSTYSTGGQSTARSNTDLYFGRLAGAQSPWSWSQYGLGPEAGGKPPMAGHAPSMSGVSTAAPVDKYAWSKDPIKGWHRFYWEGKVEEASEVQDRGTVIRHFDCYNSWEGSYEAPHNFDLWKFSRYFYTQTTSKGGSNSWTKYASLPMQRMEVRSMARQVSEIAPRTVHDVKPLFVLFQSLLRFLLDDQLDIYLAELEDVTKELRNQKSLSAAHLEAELGTLKDAFETQIKSLTEILADTQGRLADAHTEEEEAYQAEQERIRDVVPQAPRPVDPHSRGAVAHDLLAALEEHRGITEDRERRRVAAVDLAIKRAELKKNNQVEEDQSARAQIEALQAEVKKLRDKVRTQGDLLVQSENHVLQMDKERQVHMLALERAQLEASEWKERATAAEEQVDTLAAALEDCTCQAAEGVPVVGRVKDRDSKKRRESDSFAGISIFADMSDAAAKVRDADGARAVAEVICARLHKMCGLSVAFAVTAAPDTRGAPMRGVEYVAASGDQAELVGRAQDYSVGLAPEVAANRAPAVVRDACNNKGVYWWRNAESTLICATGAPGKGCAPAARKGTVSYQPVGVAAGAGGAAAGVLIADTVGRPARLEMSPAEHQIVAEAAEVLGEAFAAAAAVRDKHTQRVMAYALGVRERQGSWASATWPIIVSEMAEFTVAVKSVEAALAAEDARRELVQLVAEADPAVEAVYVMTAALLFVRRADLPKSLSFPMSEKVKRAVWDAIKGRFSFAPPADGELSTLQQMRLCRHRESHLDSWRQDSETVREAMSFVGDFKISKLPAVVGLVREWVLLQAKIREMFKMKVEFEHVEAKRNTHPWDVKLLEDETRADRDAPLSAESKDILRRAEHKGEEYRRVGSKNVFKAIPRQGVLRDESEGGADPLGRISESLPVSGV